MLRYLKRAMRERRSTRLPAVLGWGPLVFLLVSGAASPQLAEGSANPEDNTDPSSSEVHDSTQEENSSIRFDERPGIQFNVTRGTGPRLSEEQVIVRGQMSPSGSRRRVDAAVEETWGAFNEMNSDDQFDVHCRYEARTGTRIPQHVCRPQFLDDATSRGAAAMLQLDKGSSFGLQQVEAARAYYMQQRLEGELRGLATSDPAIREQLGTLDEQLERYEEARGSQD
jgi:hypothetical protein